MSLRETQQRILDVIAENEGITALGVAWIIVGGEVEGKNLSNNCKHSQLTIKNLSAAMNTHSRISELVKKKLIIRIEPLFKASGGARGYKVL